jgi:RNA polymerase sigma-70 factor (ECF subfamily)
LDDLLARVARGDQTAFEVVYRHVSGPVFGLVLRVLRDRAQAEEVTQEVLVAVWRTATRFDPARGSARAWVMTIAHRRAVDRVRAEQSANERLHRAGVRDIVPAYDEVVETVEIHLDQQAVRRALACLTDVQRQAVELAYYRGHSYPEVARLLDVPLGTVKTRMRDGLIRLRDHLGVSA